MTPATTTGQRNTQKIFGAVALRLPRFHFRQDTVFNGQTYTQTFTVKPDPTAE